MKGLLKIASCFFLLNFEGVMAMHMEIQSSDQSTRHFEVPTTMGVVAMQGSFLMVPVSKIPTLYLVSQRGTETFTISEDVDISALKSLLCSKGINQIASVLLETSSDVLRRDNTMSITTSAMLPAGMSSAIDYFTNHSSIIPEDEKSLFFLKSLLLLGKADSSLINSIDDKLSEYESYYDPDPYIQSSKRLHEIGIYEYSKMFTEECFSDLQIVLEFSKLTKIQNADSRRNFEIFLRVLKVIVETTKENSANAMLLQKFKSLYERINEK